MDKEVFLANRNNLWNAQMGIDDSKEAIVHYDVEDQMEGVPEESILLSMFLQLRLHPLHLGTSNKGARPIPQLRSPALMLGPL